jgi:hypothetical protein
VSFNEAYAAADHAFQATHLAALFAQGSTDSYALAALAEAQSEQAQAEHVLAYLWDGYSRSLTPIQTDGVEARVILLDPDEFYERVAAL